MELNKIAELLAIVESLLRAIKDEQTSADDKKLTGWKVLSHLTQVFGIVNSSNIRAPGQILVARLIIEESNRLIDEMVDSIGDDTPEEFNLMIDSIKVAGHKNDIQKTL